ncbi:hypothetical protein EI94DRAFT_1707879 [Lactarius quietus]|nr:hypothetical protein EI94DRAFT_1707879 [Lactarius quietus]
MVALSYFVLVSSHGHLNGIRHYYESSSEDARFSVEPGSAEDLSKIIKGGGHTSNLGFSSTQGIQISMLWFNKISFNNDKTQLTVGEEAWGLEVGCWEEVQIVLPDGRQVVTALANDESELFWAIKQLSLSLKLIVKALMVMDTYVYGGILTFDKAHVECVKGAIVNFMTKQEPKAAIEAIFRYYRNHGIQEVFFPSVFAIFKFTVLAFYDDKKPVGSDPFSEFLAIPHQGRLTNSRYTKLDAAKTLLYSHIPADVATEFLSTPEDDDSAPFYFPSSEVAGMGVINARCIIVESIKKIYSFVIRARWGSVMVSKYMPNLINVVQEEAKV